MSNSYQKKFRKKVPIFACHGPRIAGPHAGNAEKKHKETAMKDEKQEQTDARRLEKEQIEDLGTVTLARGEHIIHCLTVIGQVEGHSEAPQG